MKPRTGLVLLALGVVALLGGWYFGVRTQPTAGEVASGRLAFPGLAATLQSAARVEIVHHGKTLVIEKHGAIWGLADRGLYPVQGDKLRAVLTGLTELRLVAKRTDHPAELELLGLGDPASATSAADLLRVLDASGKPIAAIVLGHRKVLTGGDVPQEIYVRWPGQNQAWLAEGTVEIDADPSLWLDRDIADIQHDTIKSIDVTTPGEHLTFASRGGKLVLTAPAQHPPLDRYKIEDMQRAFEYLTFEDVRPGPVLPGKAAGQAVFTTSDGMVVHVTLNEGAKHAWAAFSAAGGRGGAALEARVKGWVYQLGSWKRTAFVPTLADLAAKSAAAAK
jgi:hypothetical protein